MRTNPNSTGGSDLPFPVFVEAAMSRCIRICICITQAWKAVPLAMALTAAAVTFAAELNGPMSSSLPAEGASAAASAGMAGKADFNVEKLFANSCGWCHSSAGRVAGKGPQLMNTTLTDAQIIYRVKNGKIAAMPAFGASFSDEQMTAIVKYIRDLKPDASTQ